MLTGNIRKLSMALPVSIIEEVNIHISCCALLISCETECIEIFHSWRVHTSCKGLLHVGVTVAIRHNE